MTASQRIKHIIKSKNLSIEAFAEQVGTTRGTLNQMFKNDSNPKLPPISSLPKFISRFKSKVVNYGKRECMGNGGF